MADVTLTGSSSLIQSIICPHRCYLWGTWDAFADLKKKCCIQPVRKLVLKIFFFIWNTLICSMTLMMVRFLPCNPIFVSFRCSNMSLRRKMSAVKLLKRDLSVSLPSSACCFWKLWCLWTQRNAFCEDQTPNFSFHEAPSVTIFPH